MANLLIVNVPSGWAVKINSFYDEEPFDSKGERNYSVSENLYSADLNTKNGIYTIDVGFYQNIYRIYVVKNNDWDNPVIQKEFTNRMEAKQFVEEMAKKYANETT